MAQYKKELPLKRITVIDLTRLIPGAFCTTILSDSGAKVIKVEETSVGDYERQIGPFIGDFASRFLILNRNKKSLALNLKNNSGREAFLKLVSQADVLIEGFRPGTMAKLKLDYENLKKLNHRLIYCSISSFGQDGPYKNVIAHDLNILGIAGLLSITGSKKGDPVIPGLQIADTVAGMSAAIAILLSLIERSISNRGRLIDISMLDSLFSLMFDSFRYISAKENVPNMGEGRLWGGYPNYNIYKTSDEKYITVAALETKFKNALLKKLGREDLILDSDSLTSSNSSSKDKEIYDFLKAEFRKSTRDELMEIFKELNICIGPVNKVNEAINNSQLLYRNMIIKLLHPSDGEYFQIGSPFKSKPELCDVLQAPAPKLGEHSREILKSIGYNDKEINEFIKNKVIGENDSKLKQKRSLDEK